MVYLYVEDSNDGLYLMELAQSLYKIDSNMLKIDTFDGIFNIVKHIKNLNITSKDSVYYLYDNVEGNTDIPRNIKNATNILVRKNIQNRVSFIAIVCCEYSILVAKHMEMFIDRKSLLHCISIKLCNSNKLTTETKQMSEFDDIYNNIRNKQRKKLISRGNLQNVSNNSVEATVTAEKLCKYIFHQAFNNELLPYDRKLKHCGKCWDNDCCIKDNRRGCNISIKSRKLSSLEKEMLLLQGAHFYSILNKICRTEGIPCDEQTEIRLDDIRLNNKIQEIYDKYKYNVKICKENMYMHLQMKHSIEEAVELCKESNFDDYIIKAAINEIIV